MIYCPNCKNKVEIDVTDYFQISSFLHIRNKEIIAISALRMEVLNDVIKPDKITCINCNNQFSIEDLMVHCFFCGKPVSIKNICWYNSEYYCKDCGQQFNANCSDSNNFSIIIRG